MVWLDGQGLQKNMIRKLTTRKCGEEVCRMGQNTKIPVHHIRVYQRVVLAREDINNQMDRMTYSVSNTATYIIPQ